MSACVRASLTCLSRQQRCRSAVFSVAQTRRFGIFDSLFSGSGSDKKQKPLEAVSLQDDSEQDYDSEDDTNNPDDLSLDALDLNDNDTSLADSVSSTSSSSQSLEADDGFQSVQRGPARSYTLDTPRTESMAQAMHETDVARSIVEDPELPGELEVPGGLNKAQFRYLFTESDFEKAGAVAGVQPERPLDDLDLFTHEKVSYDQSRLTTSFPRLDLNEPELTASDRERLVKQALSWRNSSAPEIHKQRIANILSKWGRKMGDSGSPEVQIAVMTERIKMMGRHLSTHRKDTKCKFYLNHVLQKRRKLMGYLRRQNMPRYKILCEELGLKDVWDERFMLRTHNNDGFYSKKHPIKYMKTQWNTRSGRRYF